MLAISAWTLTFPLRRLDGWSPAQGCAQSTHVNFRLYIYDLMIESIRVVLDSRGLKIRV